MNLPVGAVSSAIVGSSVGEGRRSPKLMLLRSRGKRRRRSSKEEFRRCGGPKPLRFHLGASQCRILEQNANDSALLTHVDGKSSGWSAGAIIGQVGFVPKAAAERQVGDEGDVERLVIWLRRNRVSLDLGAEASAKPLAAVFFSAMNGRTKRSRLRSRFCSWIAVGRRTIANLSQCSKSGAVACACP